MGGTLPAIYRDIELDEELGGASPGHGVLTPYIDEQEVNQINAWHATNGLHSIEGITVLDFLVANLDRYIDQASKHNIITVVHGGQTIVVPIDNAVTFGDLRKESNRWRQHNLTIPEREIAILEDFVLREPEIRRDLSLDLSEQQLDDLFHRARYLAETGTTDFDGYVPPAR